MSYKTTTYCIEQLTLIVLHTVVCNSHIRENFLKPTFDFLYYVVQYLSFRNRRINKLDIICGLYSQHSAGCCKALYKLLRISQTKRIKKNKGLEHE